MRLFLSTVFSVIFLIRLTACSYSKQNTETIKTKYVFRGTKPYYQVLDTETSLTFSSPKDLKLFFILLDAAGQKISVQAFSKVNKTISNIIKKRIETSESGKAFDLWQEYVRIFNYDTKIVQDGKTLKLLPDKNFIKLTERLFKEAQQEGKTFESLYTLAFLEYYGKKNLEKEKSALFQWIKTEDRIKYKLCKRNTRTSKKCRRHLSGDKTFGKIMNSWLSPYTINFSKRFFFGKNTKIINRPNAATWILKNIPKTEQSFYLDKVVLYNIADSKFDNLLKSASQADFKKINPYLSELIISALSKKALPYDWRQLNTYLKLKTNVDITKFECNELKSKFKKLALIPYCKSKQLSPFQFYSYRKYMLESLKLNPAKKQIWEELYDRNINLLFKYAADYKFELINKELNFLYDFRKKAVKLWPLSNIFKKERLNSVKAFIFILSGKFNEAMKIYDQLIENTSNPSILLSLISHQFYAGLNNQVRKTFFKFKKLPGSLYNVIMYLKATRYMAFIEEQTGNNEKAEKLRWNAILALRNMFKETSYDELKLEMLMLMGNFYMDINEPKIAVQLFQTVLVKQKNCDVYQQILIEYISHSYTDGIFDIYNSIQSNKTCDISDKVYAALWTYYTALRYKLPKYQYEPILKYFGTIYGNTWFKNLALFALNKINSETLIKRAVTNGYKVEAYFYTAMKLQAEGKNKEAEKMFKKVLDKKITSFFETHLAYAFLKNKSPKTIKNKIKRILMR